MKINDPQSEYYIPSKGSSPPVCFSVKERIRAENLYCTRSWNKEIATRYILKINEAIVEASFFEHFQDRKFIKSVLELPLSYGCIIGCLHCASSQLHNTRFLSSEEILNIFRYITCNQVPKKTSIFRVSFAGIGDGALTPGLIEKTTLQMIKLYPNCLFTFATSGCDPEFILFINKLSDNIPVQYLQISYLHHDINLLSKIIPKATNFSFDFNKTIKILEYTNIQIRLNYVVIRGFNDDPAISFHLAHRIRNLKNITVRISSMNETAPSRENDLKPPLMKQLKAIHKIFVSEGIASYIFASHHNDNLNCGQLAGKYQ